MAKRAQIQHKDDHPYEIMGVKQIQGELWFRVRWVGGKIVSLLKVQRFVTDPDWHPFAPGMPIRSDAVRPRVKT